MEYKNSIKTEDTLRNSPCSRTRGPKRLRTKESGKKAIFALIKDKHASQRKNIPPNLKAGIHLPNVKGKMGVTALRKKLKNASQRKNLAPNLKAGIRLPNVKGKMGVTALRKKLNYRTPQRNFYYPDS